MCSFARASVPHTSNLTASITEDGRIVRMVENRFFFFSNDKLNREKEHGFVFFAFFFVFFKKQKKKLPCGTWRSVPWDYYAFCIFKCKHVLLLIRSSFLSDKYVLLWILSKSDISLIKAGWGQQLPWKTLICLDSMDDCCLIIKCCFTLFGCLAWKLIIIIF